MLFLFGESRAFGSFLDNVDRFDECNIIGELEMKVLYSKDEVDVDSNINRLPIFSNKFGIFMRSISSLNDLIISNDGEEEKCKRQSVDNFVSCFW